jgi:hypothetical protein
MDLQCKQEMNMNSRYDHSRRARILGGISLVAALLAGSTPAFAVNPNEQLIFPAATGPFSPTLDGEATESGWTTQAFYRPLEDGAPNPISQIRGITTTDAIYLYIEAVNTSSFNKWDRLVIAFNPDGAPGNFRRLIVKPCSVVVQCVNGAIGVAPEIGYNVGSLSDLTMLSPTYSTTPPAGVQLSRASRIDSGNHWSIELRLDRATFGLTGARQVPFYVDTLTTNATNTALPTSALQSSWPANSPLKEVQSSPTQDVSQVVLPEPRWGNALLDSSLPGGVQVVGFSNYVPGFSVDPSKIALNRVNRIAATLINGGAATTGINVRFKLAGFGLNPANYWDAAWVPLPSTSAAAAPPTATKDLASRQYGTFQSDDWLLQSTRNFATSGQNEVAYFTTNYHQCVQVEVLQGGILMPSLTRQFNMDFQTVNSPFDDQIAINTESWLRAFPNAQSISLTEEFSNVSRDLDWQSKFDGLERTDKHTWQIRNLGKENAIVRSSVLVSEKLKLPLRDFKLDIAALTAGKTITIPIEPGQPITLLAAGVAKLGSTEFGPDGLVQQKGEQSTARERIDSARLPLASLQRGKTVSLGQLIGSTDGFRTTFAVGSATTLRPSRKASTLQLRLAGNPKGAQGTWYLQVVGAQVSNPALKGLGAAVLPLGANLPTYVVRGSLDTGETVTVDGTRMKVLVPIGSYGSYIYRVRAGQLMPERFMPIRPIDPRINPRIPVTPIDPRLTPVRPIEPVQPAGPG